MAARAPSAPMKTCVRGVGERHCGDRDFVRPGTAGAKGEGATRACVLELRIAMMAAMKKVLSPISEARMTPQDFKKPSANRDIARIQPRSAVNSDPCIAMPPPIKRHNANRGLSVCGLLQAPNAVPRAIQLSGAAAPPQRAQRRPSPQAAPRTTGRTTRGECRRSASALHPEHRVRAVPGLPPRHRRPQRQPQHPPRVGRVDHAVVPQPRRGEAGRALGVVPLRKAASSSAGQAAPPRARFSRSTSASTAAAWSPPITEMRALGFHMNRKLARGGACSSSRAASTGGGWAAAGVLAG